VFALLFFYIVNAMVSYDLNDNKLLFTFIALALAGLSGRGQGSGAGTRLRVCQFAKVKGEPVFDHAGLTPGP